MGDEPADETTEHEIVRPSEGVRIIGAMEASEVVASGNTGSTPAVGAPSAPGDELRGDHGTEGDTVLDEVVSEIPPVTPAETFELPHYTGPPTGQVPRVVIGEGTEASWAGLGDQPRWRDTEQHFDEQPAFTDLVAEGTGVQATEPSRPLETSAPEPTGPHEPVRPAVAVFDASDDLTGDSEPAVGSGSSAAVEGDEQIARRPPTPRRRPRPEGVAFGAASTSEATGGGRNLPVAVGVGVTFAAIAIGCFALGSIATTILVTVVIFIAAIEFFTTLTRAGYQPAGLLGIAAVAGLGIAPLFRGWFAYPIIFGLVTLAALAWFLFVQTGEGSVMNLGVTILGVAYIGGLGSFATLLLGVARPHEGTASNQGIGILFAAIMVTVINDVGAYFIGKRFGRTPLNAASPNKTQEGLLGGFLCAIAVPLLVIQIANLQPVNASLWKAFAFCLICAVMAPVGDLCESAIKRDLKVKDMGTLLPGHGGMLDRVDGLLFVLPTAYFMAHLLSLGRPAFF